jgi:putative flippase GtrA
MKRIAERVSLGELLSVARAGQFLSIGVVGAICDNAVLVGLVELGHLQPTIAKLGAAETAILVMFVLNENVTFADAAEGGPRAILRRLVTSHVVRAGGALTAIAVLYVLNGQFGVWYLAANVAGMVVGLFVNYVFESIVTWGVGRN